MKASMWIGLLLVVLGLVSLAVPIPHTEHHGIKIGDSSLGVETKHDEKLPAWMSGVLILGGATLMIVGKRS